MNLGDFHPESTNPTRRSLGAKDRFIHWLVGSPGSAWAVIIIIALTAVLALVAVGMSRRVLVSPGQVMDHTRVARVPIEITDPSQTLRDRESARQKTPRVFVERDGVITRLVTSLYEIPEISGTPAESTTRKAVARLEQLLHHTPILAPEPGERAGGGGGEEIELAWPPMELPPGFNGTVRPPRPLFIQLADAINVNSSRHEGDLRLLALKAGLTGEALEAVTAKLAASREPTFQFDRAMTQQRQDHAAINVQPRVTKVDAGSVLYAKGEVLTTDALERVELEEARYRATAPSHQRLAADAGLATAAMLIALGLGAYLGTFAPGMIATPRKLATLCVMFAAALIISCGATLIEPKLLIAAMVVPAVFLAAVLVVAYERRLALVVGSLQGVAAALTMHQPIETAILPMLGVALMVWQLREIRHRWVLIRAGFLAGALTAGVTLCTAALRRPLVGEAVPQMFFDAGTVGIGVLLVGFVVLGLLPTIERSFGVVTALSLIELRDPSHPLLRQLQQRAPGTYSHSMNVASLAETAAQSIGANGLLAYVGSLYHDVGKMNRPEFFVENQGNVNRHDKLPPAMSTLMIVSHVPDGLALAKEHALPRPLLHFIESHHGTTLVEYFYRRAQKQHEDATGGKLVVAPVEGEYRYPGPKPRTKEVAVVMICDACESTARTLPDHTPVKIEQMARSICDKRLADGQFDECELTMRELTTIVQTVTKTLAGIHHQRVVYPSGPTIKPGGGAGGATARAGSAAG